MDEPIDQTSAEPEAPPVIARLHDGTLLRFPPGTSPDVVQATVKRQIEARTPKPDIAGTAIDTALRLPSGAARGAMDVGTGIVKGIGQTAADVGKSANTIAQKLFNRPMLPEGETAWADTRLQPTDTAQGAGKMIERAAEYAVPGLAADTLATRAAARIGGGMAVRLGARAAAGSAANAATAAVHGENVPVAAAAGALGPAVGEAAGAAGEALGRRALPLVRAGLKPLVSELKRVPGASRTGVNAEADRMAQFALDHRLTGPEQAADLVTDLEGRIAQAVQGSTATVNGPQRAWANLDALAQDATSSADVAAIRRAQEELLHGTGRIGRETAIDQPVAGAAPGGTAPQTFAWPGTAAAPTQRVLRTDMSPAEALDLARASGRWNTNKQWGELKGADTEAAKRIESGLRDSVRDAVPEAAPLLQQQGQAIRIRGAMDRMALREGNRNAVSLEGAIGMASPAVKGNLFGVAAHWLRNNQVRAGIYADDLSRAIANQDAQAVTKIMGMIGVGATEGAIGSDAQQTHPALRIARPQ